MNLFHNILFVMILAYVSSALAADNNSFAVALLRDGTYDIAKVDGEGKYAIGWRDSTSGMYLYVEYGRVGPCCDIRNEYLGLAVGKKLDSGKKRKYMGSDRPNQYGFVAIRTKKGKSARIGKIYKVGI